MSKPSPQAARTPRIVFVVLKKREAVLLLFQGFATRKAAQEAASVFTDYTIQRLEISE
jgi:hypothetical protein